VLYEFAITPDVFDSAVIETDQALRITVIEILRGLSENGLLANLHKDAWVRFVEEERLSKLSPGLRDKILSCLKILRDRNRLVRHPRSLSTVPVSDLDWLMLAVDSHHRKAFHGIILTEELRSQSGISEGWALALTKVLDSPNWLDRKKRTLPVTRTESAYRSALEGILCYARVVRLIDPYLDSHDARFFTTLDLCSDLLGRRPYERLKGRIHIHAHRDKQKPEGFSDGEQMNKWERALKPLAQRDGHLFKVFLWRELPGGEPFHDRFLITDQCGISIPSGLAIPTRKTPGSTTWSLLDEDARQNSIYNVDPAARTLQLVGDPLDVS
jgi:hypothetical protein